MINETSIYFSHANEEKQFEDESKKWTCNCITLLFNNTSASQDRPLNAIFHVVVCTTISSSIVSDIWDNVLDPRNHNYANSFAYDENNNIECIKYILLQDKNENVIDKERIVHNKQKKFFILLLISYIYTYIYIYVYLKFIIIFISFY